MDTTFRGNSGAVLELGEAGLALLLECRCFDVEHHLITLAREPLTGMVSPNPDLASDLHPAPNPAASARSARRPTASARS